MSWLSGMLSKEGKVHSVIKGTLYYAKKSELSWSGHSRPRRHHLSLCNLFPIAHQHFSMLNPSSREARISSTWMPLQECFTMQLLETHFYVTFLKRKAHQVSQLLNHGEKAKKKSVGERLKLIPIPQLKISSYLNFKTLYNQIFGRLYIKTFVYVLYIYTNMSVCVHVCIYIDWIGGGMWFMMLSWFPSLAVLQTALRVILQQKKKRGLLDKFAPSCCSSYPWQLYHPIIEAISEFTCRETTCHTLSSSPHLLG